MKRAVFVALSQFCETDDAPRRRLLEAGYEVRQNISGRRLKYEEIVSAAENADAVIAGVEPYDAAILEELPKLQCISRCGVGTDAIDLDAAKRHRIAVLTTPDEVAEPAAQLTVAMMLALCRNIQRYAAEMPQGIWCRREGRLLSEWTIGLVGFGRIGRRVAKYLGAFGAKILISDPAVHREDIPDGIELREFPHLLGESDLISLHANRRSEEGPLMDASAFAQMRQGSCLVNTARGYLVDEKALCAALQSGQLAGAALDVYSHEPYSGALLGFPQVLCTPHVATLTNASRRAMELRAVENVIHFFKGATR